MALGLKLLPRHLNAADIQVMGEHLKFGKYIQSGFGLRGR